MIDAFHDRMKIIAGGHDFATKLRKLRAISKVAEVLADDWVITSVEAHLIMDDVNRIISELQREVHKDYNLDVLSSKAFEPTLKSMPATPMSKEEMEKQSEVVSCAADAYDQFEEHELDS